MRARLDLLFRLCVLLLALLWIPACQDSPPQLPATGEPVAEEAGTSGPDEKETGRWHPFPGSIDLTPAQREAVERLGSVPYLQGSHLAPDRDGVTIFRPRQVQPGLNLFNSGHGPEAFLTDLQGRVLHRWSYPIERIWPEERGVHQSSYWRRVHWFPDGDILAIFEGIGLIRLDRESRLEWAYKGMFHHQAAVDASGTIWTLRRKPVEAPWVNADQPILMDYATSLSPEGDVLKEISLLKAFMNSPYQHLLEKMKREGDVFHTNSVEILDGRLAGRAPWLGRGHLLLSLFYLDTICVLDPVQERIVWALRGDGQPSFKGQHDPRLLPGGHLLLLDNWGRSGKSRVIEFDPLSLDIRWQYPDHPESDFYSATCGTAQRLPNGNTLVTESDRGRALEVTPQGEIVWEFLNPNRAGDRRELIATLFELKRVPVGYLDDH